MTKEEINKIHLRGLAIKNKRYFDDEGNVYIGFENGRLKLLDKAQNTTFKSTINIRTKDVQSTIEKIIVKQDETLIKETEIDFGKTLYQTTKKLFITDSDINEEDIVIAQLAYKKPSEKDLDEVEMDNIDIKAGPYNGGAYLYIMSSTGSLHDKFVISYQIRKK